MDADRAPDPEGARRRFELAALGVNTLRQLECGLAEHARANYLRALDDVRRGDVPGYAYVGEKRRA